MTEDIKLIAFDVDGTLASGNIWQRVHAIAGVTPEEDSRWFTDYYTKKITYQQWAEFITAVYAKSGKKKEEFKSTIQYLKLVPGATEVVSALREKYTLCLVSSGLDFYVREVARQLNISEWYANYSLVYNAEGIVQTISYQAPEDEAKVLVLQKLCQTHKITPDQIVFVGDSSNDLPAFRFTHHGILVGEGNEALIAAAWKQVKTISEVGSFL